MVQFYHSTAWLYLALANKTQSFLVPSRAWWVSDGWRKERRWPWTYEAANNSRSDEIQKSGRSNNSACICAESRPLSQDSESWRRSWRRDSYSVSLSCSAALHSYVTEAPWPVALCFFFLLFLWFGFRYRVEADECSFHWRAFSF